MATRFYLPADIAPPITPAYAGDWDRTVEAARRWMSTVKQSTSLATVNAWDYSTSSPYDALVRQYISEPLEAQNISGYVKGQLRVYQANADDDFCRAIVIKVVSKDGSTVRGTLLSHFPASLESEFATSLTNRYYPPSTALSSVDAEEGDRIVVEIGWRDFNSKSSVYAYFRFGDSASSDLPENESSTDDYNPWIEFSATLDFLDQINVLQNIVQVEYDVPPNIQAHQVIVQVEYEPTPVGQFTKDAEVTVELTPSADTDPEFVFDAPVTVELTPSADTLLQGAGEFVTDAPVTVTLTPESDTLWTRVGVAEITVILEPDAETSCPVRVTDAAVTIEVLPSAVTRIPVIGWDSASGYGEVDISDLDQSPPFWCPETLVELSIDPAAASYSLYAEFGHEAEGGLVLGGEPSVTIIKPRTYQVVARGGVKVGGAGAVAVDRGKVVAIVAVGGLKISGTASVKWIGQVSAPPVYSYVGQKGLVVTGKPSLTVFRPTEKDVVKVAEGGVKVGGPIRYPEAAVTRPKVKDILVAYVGSGGLEISSEGGPVVVVPPITIIQTQPAKIIVWGAGGPVVIRPRVIEWAAEGGVAVGEEPPATACETWVLTGVAKEPSVYTNYPFNSYALVGNRVLAAAEDGIYELGGSDDNGAAFHTGVRIATNFGKDTKKRLRSIYCGDSGHETEVRVESEGKTCYSEWDRDRFSIDQNVQGRELVIDIAGFEQLSQLEVTPLEIAR